MSTPAPSLRLSPVSLRCVPAVIPLTDSEHRLLSLHFAVDPGRAWDWGQDDNDNGKLANLILSLEAKLNVLHNYMNVTWIRIPSETRAPLAQPESPTASAGEDVQSLADSMDSDRESVCSNTNVNNGKPGKEKDRDKQRKDKEKDKNRTDSVANKLGTLSKSLGIKLKKNMGGLGGLVHGKISKSNSGNNGRAHPRHRGEGQEEGLQNPQGQQRGVGPVGPVGPVGQHVLVREGHQPLSHRPGVGRLARGEAGRPGEAVRRPPVGPLEVQHGRQAERQHPAGGHAGRAEVHLRRPAADQPPPPVPRGDDQLLPEQRPGALQRRAGAEEEGGGEEAPDQRGATGTGAGAALKKPEQESAFQKERSDSSPNEGCSPVLHQSRSSQLALKAPGRKSPTATAAAAPFSSPGTGAKRAGPVPVSAHYSHTPPVQRHSVIHLRDVNLQPSGAREEPYRPAVGTLKTCATYPQQNRTLSSHSYSPARLPGLRGVGVDAAQMSLGGYGTPGGHKSHTYTNGFGASDVRDRLEFADEGSPRARPGHDRTKGRGGGALYCPQQEQCKRENCSFYGRPETENFCSYCFKEELKRREREREGKVHRPG
ncbi:hypothetical protein AAFF_G00107250 [Aldrovandia affinis]|uniref:ubiquitinyl hydrolase 1 n=1 Tax=Aldrovandia affinis TaxID=143900 RepID=A0AAD7WY18_9TELE|nr:hypothetical protein AAFF_G00107250 [Aldrovandia affinis]